MNFLQRLVPDDVELRVLLHQRLQLQERPVHVGALGQEHLIGEDRFQDGLFRVRLVAQAVPGQGVGETGEGADRSGGDLLGGGEFGAGVDAYLVNLLRPGVLGVRVAGEGGFDRQGAAGELEPGQAGALFVVGNFEHLGAEPFGVVRHLGVPFQAVQKLGHPFQFQRGAEVAGEHRPLGDGIGEGVLGHVAAVQKLVQKRLVAHGHLLLEGVPSLVGGEVHTAIPQQRFQLVQQRLPPQAVQVGFVHKEEGGDVVLPQQLPQGGRVPLDAVGGADDQDGVVQHLQGAFHLGGEIHVTGGVQQGDDLGGQGEDGLFGEDGDAPLPLQGEGVQKGGAVIHPPHLFDAAAQVEQPFGEGGLAGVHVGEDAHD